MTTETLMTEAATTTEGATASEQATQQPATGAGDGGQQQQATEGQGTQGQQAEGTKTEGEQEKKPEGAPESYEFKAPEGTQFDDAVIGAFSEVAKELNLPQDQAQKVLDKMAPVIAASLDNSLLEGFPTSQYSPGARRGSDLGEAGAEVGRIERALRKILLRGLTFVEAIVNEAIVQDIEVTCEEMTVDEARESGAIGLFESKYGSKVKVYTVPGFSREICGGPHAAHTGELGRFEIKKEEASSAGVRRIKAVLIHG